MLKISRNKIMRNKIVKKTQIMDKKKTDFPLKRTMTEISGSFKDK